MFTPQRKAWPRWSPLYEERKEKGTVACSIPVDTILAATESSREISPAKGLIRSVVEGDGCSVGQSETDIWRHFKEVGALDEGSIEKKDRATLMGHISRLESELYDYQYNMGLLLMERNEWGQQTEKLKSIAQDAEEKLRRELAGHLLLVAEAEKREQSLKQALAAEKLCVYDLENALKEVRSESAEIKLLAENKLKEAQELISGTTNKALEAESKLHMTDALLAELSHKQGIAERKLREAEAQEDNLRRERLAFKAQQEANEKELNRQKQSFLEWEKKLEEGQARLLEGQKLLNQTEESINQTESALKKMKNDLQAMKKQMEDERSSLQQLEADCSSKLSSVAIREEVIVKKEIALETKEHELILLKEMLSNRERILEKRDENVNATEILVSKEREHIEALEKTLKQREATLSEKQHNLTELQTLVEQQKEEANSKKADYEQLFKTQKLLKQELIEEQKRLTLTKQEREEQLKLQTCLKEEIDDYRAKTKSMSMEAAELSREKERFEKEWQMLDEKSESVKKAMEKVDEEAQRVSAWLLAEEVRLKEERRLLQDQMRKESEALKLEMEAFTRRIEHEKAEWFASVEKEKEDLVRDLEQRRRDLETNIAKQREDIENHLREEELRMKRELERESEKIIAPSEVAGKELEEVRLERLELEKMREEIARRHKESEQQWIEIRKNINELGFEKEKLKEQSEALIKQREENIEEAERLKKLRIQQQQNEELLSHGNRDKMLRQNSGPDLLPSEAEDSTFQFPLNVDGRITDGKLTESPARLWLQKCVSGVSVSPEKMANSSGTTKDLEESNASLGSELGNNQLDTRSDGGQVGFNPVSRSSASFTPSSTRGRLKKSQKAKTPSCTRAPPTSTLNVDADRLYESQLRHKEIISSHEYKEGLQMHEEKFIDSGTQSAIEHDKDTMSYIETRKRAFSQTTDTMSEAETGDMEAESEITTGGKRRRPNKDLGISLASGLKETPRTKRYNLRRSTVSSTKTGASKTVAGRETHDQENLNDVKRNLW